MPPSHVKGFNNMAVTADTAASSDDADQALEEVHNVVDQTAQSEMQPLDQLIFTSKSRCTGRSCDRQDVDTQQQKSRHKLRRQREMKQSQKSFN